MRACTMASGGVMFIPDELERTEPKSVQSSPVNYSELSSETATVAEQERPLKKKRVFGLFGKKEQVA